ncbi:MAG: DUF192 domain-containing protein [Candidatus Colwellbacteria bacterium]|nr:DUF192 domain-containing protein [Candidatus Colwellbacteria bacterium]MBI3274058.1 DUF192 domain-containing protein [Candidatus Colwellbacteria bacterium]
MYQKLSIVASGIALTFLFLLSYKHIPVFLGVNTKSVVIGGEEFRVEVAATPIKQTKGLSGRDGLGLNAGMLFPFSELSTHSFWMKDMKFPIDIIWIQNDKVVGFEENMEPGSSKSDAELRIYSPPSPINNVLEVAAGTVLRLGVKIGDAISIKL